MIEFEGTRVYRWTCQQHITTGDVEIEFIDLGSRVDFDCPNPECDDPEVDIGDNHGVAPMTYEGLAPADITGFWCYACESGFPVVVRSRFVLRK